MAGNMKEFTDTNWKSEVLDSPIPVVVDFWAPWCNPCLKLAPTIEKLAAEYEGKVKFGKMNCDENQEIPGSGASVRFRLFRSSTTGNMSTVWLGSTGSRSSRIGCAISSASHEAACEGWPSGRRTIAGIVEPVFSSG